MDIDATRSQFTHSRAVNLGCTLSWRQAALVVAALPLSE
jgi:hypothetical protein